MIGDTYLIQIQIPDGTLLILTEVEYDRAWKRGDSVLHNRKLKRRALDSEVIKAKEVKYA